MKGMYTVDVTVTDQETGNALYKAEIPIANHADVFEEGAATPGLVPVVAFLQQCIAFGKK